MSLEGTVLYEQFSDARREAVELTDQYHAIPHDDPHRAEVWDRVVHQTEAARQLLEQWLRRGTLSDVGDRVDQRADDEQRYQQEQGLAHERLTQRVE
jgi:hypothetical protein